jgi:hypothetical protein
MYVSGSFVVSFPQRVEVLMLWRVGDDGEGGIVRSIGVGGIVMMAMVMARRLQFRIGGRCARAASRVQPPESDLSYWGTVVSSVR